MTAVGVGAIIFFFLTMFQGHFAYLFYWSAKILSYVDFYFYALNTLFFNVNPALVTLIYILPLFFVVLFSLRWIRS